MVNKVILLGNVGADPEVRALEGGSKVARIRVATSEKYTDKNGNKQELTEWHNVSLFKGLADVVERYVHKGSQVYIEGKLRTREYEQNGEKRYATEIIANELKLFGRAKDASESPQAQSAQVTPQVNDAPF